MNGPSNIYGTTLAIIIILLIFFDGQNSLVYIQRIKL